MGHRSNSFGVTPRVQGVRIEDFLAQPTSERPVLLEGRWLDDSSGCHWAAAGPSSVLEGSLDALDQLPAWLDREGQKHPDGVAIGFISYELANHLEAVRLPSDPALPDVSFAFYPHLERIQVESSAPPTPGIPLTITSGVTYPEFKIAVEKIRAYIAAGDIYQANLTIPFSADLGGLRPESIYARLRRSNSPFRAFLKTPGRTILSDSPERFFRVSGDQILTSPIKGTIARSPQGRQDDGATLLASEKDRAENLMIVDLLRNDLGRICDYSSIHARLWEKEVLPHLVHLVSHVEGTLRPGTGIRDIVQALFPCGSITGAPKIRAMEVLAEIEQAPRGISMGAIGIIRSPSSPERVKMDFSVAIRTMVIQDGRATFNVGGGIVYDSEAAAEYSEVMLKARPLFAALGAKNIACGIAAARTSLGNQIMDSFIYHNDRIVALNDARLSPGQMGLLMGWGVFTTLRIYEGVPFAFEKHWQRMTHDAGRLGIEIGYRQESVATRLSNLPRRITARSARHGSPSSRTTADSGPTLRALRPPTF